MRMPAKFATGVGAAIVVGAMGITTSFAATTNSGHSTANVLANTSVKAMSMSHSSHSWKWNSDKTDSSAGVGTNVGANTSYSSDHWYMNNGSGDSYMNKSSGGVGLNLGANAGYQHSSSYMNGENGYGYHDSSSGGLGLNLGLNAGYSNQTSGSGYYGDGNGLLGGSSNGLGL